MERIHAGNLPLRVNQLDAYDSDVFIYDVIIDKLKDILKYLKVSSVLTTYKHEIEAIIKSILWLTVFRKLNATLGQQMLELSYTSTTNTKIVLGHMSRLQSFLYLQCNVVIPYLAAKLNEQQQKRNFPTRYPTINKLLLCMNSLWCCVNLVNFVTFLYNGKYLHVFERICGIRSTHPKGRQLREIGFDFSNREILWHAFAEFMVFVMPYINMRKLKSILSLGGDKHKFDDSCSVCDSWPTNPQQMADCKHLYCYHCVASLLVSDSVYECKSCGVKITSLDSLHAAEHRVSSST